MEIRFLFALYGIYKITLKELKFDLKLSANAGPSGGLIKSSLESTAPDDNFQEVKRHKRHNSNNIRQTAKKSTKPVPIFVTVKLYQNQC
jgi:hypothetical protein